MNTLTRTLEVIGRGVGGVVGTLYQAGRDTIEQVIRNILPFMAFISMLIGIILYTGIGSLIAHTLSPLASNIFGLLVISIICAIPVLSPLLGPGAVIAQVVGTLLGVEIGLGHIPAQYALPALFAINPQVGCDFIPVGLALGEAEPETTEIGVPAVLISRLFTGPLAVVIAYVASFGMYVGH
ncbi:MAG: PTS glucitol/sorbitol transporter subunit IIB [Ktedonobacteraceae bacterium]